MAKKSLQLLGWFFVGLFLFSAGLEAAPTFTKEPLDIQVRLASAAPQSILREGTAYRMYFIRDNAVHSATSPDQLTWTVSSATSLSPENPNLFQGTYPVTGCSVVPLDAGGFSMAYSVGVGTGPFGIFIATSADGIGFGSPSVSTAVFISTGGTYTGSPRLVEITGGIWRLFYIQDVDGGNNSADKGIFTAFSINEGVTWSTTTLVGGPAGDVAVSTRTDQRVRLFYTTPVSGGSTNITVASVLSNAGVTAVAAETGLRLSTGAADGILSSLAVAQSTETFRSRLFYNYTEVSSTETSSVFSAVTENPDPQSISPPEVINSLTDTSFTIQGEVFSLTPTVMLSKSGQPNILGTNVNRTDDQTLTVDLSPLAAAIGEWDVVVTNNDGDSGTLANALTITFAEAEVDMMNNLIRPRLNDATTIDVTIYTPGHIKILLFTMEGQLIKTLVDEVCPTGTKTSTWDGRNNDGSVVASGTYLLTFEGPKLKTTKKIVVIR